MASRRLVVIRRHMEAANDTDLQGTCSSVFPLAQQPCSAVAHATAASAARAPPVLVGGMVMDVQAHPGGTADVQRGGSVPGSVSQTPGGVARNVGEGLARLLKSAGARQQELPLLVSAVGDDLAGRALLQHWQSLGLSTACIAQLPSGATPTVSVVFDLAGEVAACVADVLLLEQQLLPPLLRQPQVTAAMAAAPVMLLDGNLSTAALEEACRQATAAGVPVWFEPVSVPKSTRATSLLSMLAYISPNEKELAAMAAAARHHQQQKWQQGCSGPQCQCAGSSNGSSPSRSCFQAGGSFCRADGSCCQASGGSCRASDFNSTCSCCASCCASRTSCCCASRTSCCCASGNCCVTSSSAAMHAPQPTQAATVTSWPGLDAALAGMLPDVATLLLAGVRHIVLTLGADGAALCTLAPGQHVISVCHMPALPATVVNCSGAGDCLVAGCLFALTQGLPAEAALAHGLAAARAAVAIQGNVPAALDAAAVRYGAAAAQALCRLSSFPLPACQRA